MAIGVNISGAELGKRDAVYGVDYVYPTDATLDYYAAQGIETIRLPVKWERLQPTLDGELDPTELGRLIDVLDAAAERGMTVIIDIHNYGRYDNQIIGSDAVPESSFADFWQKMATALEGHPGVGGYGLMNEPHDMGSADVWPSAAQAAVDAIREVDTETPIYVAGNSWSGANTWTNWNNDLDIDDPSNNIIYEAHVYFDKDNKGLYQGTYDSEGATPFSGLERIVDYVDWLDENNKQGFIGEFAVPSETHASGDPRWTALLDNFISGLDQLGLDGTIWASTPKPGWENYRLNVDPKNGVDSSQMETITKYNDGTAAYTPVMIGTKVDDVINADANDNFLYGRTGNDTLYAAGGNDTLYGASGDDYLDGGAGIDKMIGGLGNDTYVIDNASDVFKESADEGIDTIKINSTYTLKANFENLTLIGTSAINGTGNSYDNVLTGNDAANTLKSGDGNDTIFGGGGVDRLEGGAGDDKLDGGLGIDTLVGGSGADTYVFSSAAGANGDIVTSFQQGADKFDLSGIDAKASTDAMDPFSLIGSNAFSGKEGELRIYSSGGKSYIAGDVNGDKVADFQFQAPLLTYTASDFIFATGGPGGGGGGGGGGVTDPESVSSAVTFTLAAGSKNLTLTGASAIDGTGNALENLITGNDAANKLYGLGGNDTLKGGGGADRLEGGEGNDWLDGGLQADTLVGGNGNDTFAFTSVAGASGDIVTDFKTGVDKLDFSAIDAKASTGANDAFTLIGTGAFTGVEGQMRAVVTGGQIYLQGDVNGDKVADFQMQLNQQNLVVGDFIL